MRAVWPIGLVIIAVLGRHQWFVRDDWAFRTVSLIGHIVYGITLGVTVRRLGRTPPRS